MKNRPPEANDNWLLNADVQYRVTPEKGRWKVSLLFINTDNPSQLLVHTIGDYHSKRLAEIFGMNMCRTAKYPGTSRKLNANDHHISQN